MTDALRVVIDLAAFRANLAAVRRIVGPERGIIACVKANAYGHGLVDCAREALAAGAEAVGIARLDEAAALRDAGISGRIVLLGPESLDATDELLSRGVEILVDSLRRFGTVARAARKRGKPASIHLAVNTGMGRFGADEAEAGEIVERLASEPTVRWAGVMTHFPVADTDADWTREQWGRFDGIVTGWRHAGIPVPPRHAANSAAILTLPETHADLVRPGLMLYGVQPAADASGVELAPVLAWETVVAALHRLDPGASVGYGRTFVCPRPMLVATLPVGYGDGMPWAAANRGSVLVNERRAPVIGRVSMDQMTVDVTDVPNVALGDGVTIIGAQGSERIRVEEWASWVGTIPYEVTTRLSARPRRVVVNATSTGA